MLPEHKKLSMAGRYPSRIIESIMFGSSETEKAAKIAFAPWKWSETVDLSNSTSFDMVDPRAKSGIRD